MTRYQVVLRIRPLPWTLRAIRRLIGASAGRYDGSTSAPRAEIWFATLVPYRWRSRHRRHAGKRGYFWLPCPLCGNPYGGHERDYLTDKPSSVPDPLNPPTSEHGPFMSVGICPRCTRVGRGVAS